MHRRVLAGGIAVTCLLALPAFADEARYPALTWVDHPPDQDEVPLAVSTGRAVTTPRERKVVSAWLRGQLATAAARLQKRVATPEPPAEPADGLPAPGITCIPVDESLTVSDRHDKTLTLSSEGKTLTLPASDADAMALRFLVDQMRADFLFKTTTDRLTGRLERDGQRLVLVNGTSRTPLAGSSLGVAMESLIGKDVALIVRVQNQGPDAIVEAVERPLDGKTVTVWNEVRGKGEPTVYTIRDEAWQTRGAGAAALGLPELPDPGAESKGLVRVLGGGRHR